jgi:serine/threonine protein phosphatase PrpC
MDVFSHSEAGGHIENQDAFDVRPHPLDANCYLCLVADGQGGRSGGAAAAQLACSVAIAKACAEHPQHLLQANVWQRILEAADRAVDDDKAAGFTTLVGFCIADGQLCGASSGDSAAILLGSKQPGVILTADQQKNPPVGSGGAAFVSFGMKLIRPWKVLAMTDGVWKSVGFESVMQIACESEGQKLIAALLDRAKLPRTGKLQDDFTVVLLQSSES